MDDWAKRRLAELKAAAPKRTRKQKRDDDFAIINLKAAARAFRGMNCHKAMVYVWLIHQARKTGNKVILVTNTALAEFGISRDTKLNALQDLAELGVIELECRPYKNPIATLL
jgi:hypothetical protein